MAVRLNVPLVLQQRSMECWYASACMVAYFRKPGPRRGLPDKWAANSGIQLSEIVNLAKSEGLKSILTPVGTLTSGQLETMLRNFGPLWCAGKWDGFGHCIVLTGVNGNTLYINDPSPAKGARQETLAWFNQRLYRVANSIMYMPA